jgi:site-specific recombinase XerD
VILGSCTSHGGIELLGCMNLTTTQIYTHVSEDSIVEEVAKL